MNKPTECPIKWLEEQSDDIQELIFDYAKPKLESYRKFIGLHFKGKEFATVFREYIKTVGIERLEAIAKQSKETNDLDYAETVNTYETGDVLEEIKNKNKDIPSNFFCTHQWLNDCLKRIEDPTHTSELLFRVEPPERHGDSKDLNTKIKSISLEEFSQLNRQWSKMKGSRSFPLPYEVPNYFSNPIEDLLLYVNSGNYPPPELLIMLSKVFELYYLARGALSLEQVFFGNSTKGVGNDAARHAKDGIYKEFHRLVIERQHESGFSIDGLLEEIIKTTEKEQQEFRNEEGYNPEDYEFFIKSYHKVNPTAFKRSYSRWLTKNTKLVKTK